MAITACSRVASMRSNAFGQDAAAPPIFAQLLADPDLLADAEHLFGVGRIVFDTTAWLTNAAAPDKETRPAAPSKLSDFHDTYRKMRPNESKGNALAALTGDIVRTLRDMTPFVAASNRDRLAG